MNTGENMKFWQGFTNSNKQFQETQPKHGLDIQPAWTWDQ